MVTKLEVNIRTLLVNCEEMSTDESNFWRIKKFIKSLDTMIEELSESDEIYNQNSLAEYYNRLQELKTITNYKDTSALNKLKSNTKRKEVGDDLVKEVIQLKNAKNFAELRKELLNDDGVRQRTNVQNESMDQAMRYYSDVQEKITEDMLSLTRNLREQTETANEIIKRDTEIVNKSTYMSDKNLNSLSKEGEILQHHSSRACNCWKWIMIALVMMIFIFMVLFMKVMKKKTS